jgi:hypothetical protein
MQARKVFFTFVLCGTSALAGDWTTRDTWREVACQAAIWADYCQTRSGLAAGRFNENNALLGDYPSAGALTTATLGWSAAHFAISYLLPARWRPYWQVGTCCIQIAAIIGNSKHGFAVKISF